MSQNDWRQQGDHGDDNRQNRAFEAEGQTSEAKPPPPNPKRRKLQQLPKAFREFLADVCQWLEQTVSEVYLMIRGRSTSAATSAGSNISVIGSSSGRPVVASIADALRRADLAAESAAGASEALEDQRPARLTGLLVDQPAARCILYDILTNRGLRITRRGKVAPAQPGTAARLEQRDRGMTPYEFLHSLQEQPLDEATLEWLLPRAFNDVLAVWAVLWPQHRLEVQCRVKNEQSYDSHHEMPLPDPARSQKLLWLSICWALSAADPQYTNLRCNMFAKGSFLQEVELVVMANMLKERMQDFQLRWNEAEPDPELPDGAVSFQPSARSTYRQVTADLANPDHAFNVNTTRHVMPHVDSCLLALAKHVDANTFSELNTDYYDGVDACLVQKMYTPDHMRQIFRLVKAGIDWALERAPRCFEDRQEIRRQDVAVRLARADTFLQTVRRYVW